MNDLIGKLRAREDLSQSYGVTDKSIFATAADRIEMLEEALMAAMAFIDRYVDVVDGPDGIPVPNYAMALNTFLNDVLEGKDGQKV